MSAPNDSRRTGDSEPGSTGISNRESAEEEQEEREEFPPQNGTRAGRAKGEASDANTENEQASSKDGKRSGQ